MSGSILLYFTYIFRRVNNHADRGQYLRSRRLFSINHAGNHEQHYLNHISPTRYFRASTFYNGVRRHSKNKELSHKRKQIRSVTSKIPHVGCIKWLLKSRKENGKGKRRFAGNHREKRGENTNGKISEIY